jgi:hypothetical protein
MSLPKPASSANTPIASMSAPWTVSMKGRIFLSSIPMSVSTAPCAWPSVRPRRSSSHVRQYPRHAVLRHLLRRVAWPGHRLRRRRLPAGHGAGEADIQAELDRRKPGTSRHVTQRRESDTVEILSGVFEGPHHRHADRAADPQRGPAQQGLRQHRRERSAPATPTTPTGRSTASATTAAAAVRRRAKRRCASRPAPSPASGCASATASIFAAG